MIKLTNIKNAKVIQDFILKKVFIIVIDNNNLKVVDSYQSLNYQLIFEKHFGGSYILNNSLILDYNDGCGIYYLDDLSAKKETLKGKNFQDFINERYFCSLSTQKTTMNKYLSVIDILNGYEISNSVLELNIVHVKSTSNNIFLRNRKFSNLLCLDSKTLLQKWEINFNTKVSQRNDIRFIAEKEYITLFQVMYNWIIAINNGSGKIEWEVNNWYNIENMEFLGIGSDIIYYHLEDNKLHVFQDSGYFCLDFDTKKYKQYYDIRRDERYQYLTILTSTYSEGKFYFTAESRKPNETKYIYEGCNIIGVFDIDTLQILEIQELELVHQETLHTAPMVDDKYVYLQGSESNVYIFEKEEGS